MKKLLTFLYIIIAFSAKADYWTQKANFPGLSRWLAFSFVINNDGYVGCGENCLNGNTLNDFWKYDQATNVWTQKANFGGIARYGATGFSIQNKGYAGLGTNGNVIYQDFWEYDPSLNLWTQIGNFPGGARAGAVSFVIGNIAYVGTGYGSISPYEHNDLFAYYQSTNTWQQKANSTYLRSWATAFSIGNKGYIGTGTNATHSTGMNDFYEYDPITNSWTQKAFFSGNRYGAVGFAVGNMGYISTGFQASAQGCQNDIWEYSPVSNSWTQKTNLNGIERTWATGFTIGNKGYVGLGGQSGVIIYNDFWEYTNGNVTSTEELPVINFQFAISPNPAKEYATISWQSTENKNVEILITTLEGRKVFSKQLENKTSNFKLQTSNFQKGIYLVQIISNQKVLGTKKLMVE